MSVDTYLGLNLSADGPIVKELYSQVSDEANNPEIMLSGHGDYSAPSENLTPAMSTWLSGQIEPFRKSALAELASDASQFRLGNKESELHGICHDIEFDRIDKETNEKINELYASFRTEYTGQIAEKQRLASDYSRMKGELARDAKNLSAARRATPPVLAGVVEGLLNYSNLVEILPSGIIALAGTILVAAVVGCGIHFLGKGLAERQYSWAESDEARQRNMFAIFGGALAVLFILAVLFTLQYVDLQEDIDRAALLGIEAPNILVVLIQLVGFNIAIYVVGTLLTFNQYDPNPDFAEKAEDLANAEKTLDALKDKHVFQPKKKRLLERDRARLALEAKAKQMDGMPGYDQLKKKQSMIETQDARVIAALSGYRNLLQKEIAKRDKNFRFRYPQKQSFPDESTDGLTLAQFAAADLYLYKV